MYHISINIEVFGAQQNIVEQQHKIISAIPNTLVNKHINDQFTDYLRSSKLDTEILVINLSDHHALRELKVLEESDTRDKSIIIIGDKKNVDYLSVAISAGVSEFIDASNYHKELPRVINKIIFNRSITANQNKKRKLNVIVNAKGGSGASFIASNVAYKLSKFKEQHVALLDMDMQFGSIGLNFDITPKYTIAEALSEINEIDHLSLNAYLTKYSEHLNLMLSSAEEIAIPGEIEPEAVKSLLYKLQQNYNQIVIDLPRIIDPIFTMVLEQADHIAVVVQQSLVQYRDGRRLINIMNKDLDIPLEKISVIINRYDPKNSLKKSDMVNVLKHDNVFTVANDYDRVASASNLGEPLCQTAPNSKIAKDLRNIAIFLGDVQINKKNFGVFHRLKSFF